MTKKFMYLVAIIAAMFMQLTPSILQADSAPQGAMDFSAIAEKTIPAVVSIRVESYASPAPQSEDPFNFFNEEMYRRFFGMPPGRERPQQPQLQVGQGSGFLVSDDGYLLTNSHVVKEAEKITVILNDGREYNAKIIGTDPSTDVAVIKVDAENLPYLKLGNSEAAKVGEWVMAVGNPLGLQATVTVGVVSAKNRGNLDIATYGDFLQTDAAINRGNSGGPLINLDGKVIGINTAIAVSAGGGSLGVNFAIPSSMASNVMGQLMETGIVKRGFIGVTLQDINSDLADAFGLEKVQGILVTSVMEDSPAAQANLKQGDVILTYNGQPVDTMQSFRNAVSLMQPGTKVSLTISRQGKVFHQTVTLGKHPQSITSNKHDNIEQRLGLEVEKLTSEIAQQLGYLNEQGLIVSNVHPNTAAAMAGIKRGTLILSVNRQEVNSVEEFRKMISEMEKGSKVLLLIKQGQITNYVSLPLK
ncbi:MAG: DegQ family serine endoprotease [Chlamydiota bacterium]